MNWPWRRFEKFWEAHTIRRQVDELTQRKLSMIAALYSNSNWDGQENDEKRRDYIEKLEEQFNQVVRRLYNGQTDKEETEKMKANPFFAAVDRGLEKQGVPAVEEFVDE